MGGSDLETLLNLEARLNGENKMQCQGATFPNPFPACCRVQNRHFLAGMLPVTARQSMGESGLEIVPKVGAPVDEENKIQCQSTPKPISNIL